MWMINTSTIKLNDTHKSLDYFKSDNGYAVLSHRWQGSEITFQQMREGVSQETPAYEKIVHACQKAKSLGHNWLWVDTCCINKDSDAETTESINSMFQWYLKADVCLGYLYDVEAGGSHGRDAASEPGVFRKRDAKSWEASEWFFRGWTLQELLAPRNMMFYDMHWNELGYKNDLASQICAITGIDTKYLVTDRESLSSACIATKMSWMAGRRTTRDEDMAYSLVGLFNVSMLVRYGGTGTSAFVRLQEELLKKGSDDSLFAWRMPRAGAGGKLPGWTPDEWGLFAADPSWFKDSGRLTISKTGRTFPRAVDNGFAVTQNGVRIPGVPVSVRKRFMIPAMPTIFGVWILAFYQNQANKRVTLTALNCWDRETGEQIALHLVPAGAQGEMKRSRCMEFAPPPEYILTKPVAAQKAYAYGMVASRMVLQPEERYD